MEHLTNSRFFRYSILSLAACISCNGGEASKRDHLVDTLQLDAAKGIADGVNRRYLDDRIPTESLLIIHYRDEYCSKWIIWVRISDTRVMAGLFQPDHSGGSKWRDYYSKKVESNNVYMLQKQFLAVIRNAPKEREWRVRDAPILHYKHAQDPFTDSSGWRYSAAPAEPDSTGMKLLEVGEKLVGAIAEG